MPQLWFKRKTYGWGWTPSTWQGWAVTLLYVFTIVALASTLDENSSSREMSLIFVLPVVLLTVSFVRLAYKKGESPRWQWSKKDK